METIERVFMNKENGALGLGIRLSFIDKHESHDLGPMGKYRINLTTSEHDAIAAFSGLPDARGPWVVVSDPKILEVLEDLGPL